MFPECTVITYEAEPKGRALINAMAELNGTTRQVTVKGLCEWEDLKGELKLNPNALIIMDVEGAEHDLLPSAPDVFRFSELLVEIHDEICPNVGARLTERFSETHHIERYEPSTRVISTFDREYMRPFRWLPRFVKLRMLDEKRGYNYWMNFTPRQHLDSR